MGGFVIFSDPRRIRIIFKSAVGRVASAPACEILLPVSGGRKRPALRQMITTCEFAEIHPFVQPVLRRRPKAAPTAKSARSTESFIPDIRKSLVPLPVALDDLVPHRRRADPDAVAGYVPLSM